MPISSGTKLGPYEIIAPAGAGGMGEVYKARDTRLERTVAIKVLPAQLSSNANRKQRLEREARTISQFSHPNICTLYDIGHQEGMNYLVMEYLEGETLEKRLEKGPLPLNQALPLAIQIADALDKAHRHGIIHRDLKPGNIMLTKSGAKLLDFGLAKLRQEQAPIDVALTEMTTETKRLTAEGAIVGTFQYMAPEQLEGREADARSDIFAFGAVLYEMLTGKAAFGGKTKASLIAAILSSDPMPISQLQPMTPLALDRLVRTCLAKDPDERWQTAHDVKLQLQSIADSGSQIGVPAPVVIKRKIRERLAWMLAALGVLVALTLAILWIDSAQKKQEVVRFSVSPPENTSFIAPGTVFGCSTPLAISPDGRRLAFAATSANGGQSLWVRPLNRSAAQALPGTENATSFFWSPDSHFLGFFSEGKLKKIDVSGGTPQIVCDTPQIRGGTWGRDGTILFARGPEEPLYRVPEVGGTATPVSTSEATPHEFTYSWPQFLPDGQHFLASAASPEGRSIYVGSLDSRAPKRLLNVNSSGAYSPPGYLLFAQGNVLMAQAFEAKQLALSGEPIPIADHVAYCSATGLSFFSASQNGVLAYQVGSLLPMQMLWFDRTGKPLGAVGQSAEYSNPSLSPDGTRVAVGVMDPQAGFRDIWIFDLKRGTSSRFTFDPTDELNPVWSSDGTRIMFTSERRGHRDIYQKPASGIGNEELVLESTLPKSVDDWSSDGRYVVFDTGGWLSTGTQVWILPLFGDRKPLPFLQGKFNAHAPQLSPDGRWIAYDSDESGSDEVYVQTFPEPRGKWQISTSGGTEPRWRHDGKELFYIAGQRKMMAVKVKRDSSEFSAGIPEPLFELPFLGPRVRNRYVVTADGRRFLANTPTQRAISSQFNVVVNWPAELKK